MLDLDEVLHTPDSIPFLKYTPNLHNLTIDIIQGVGHHPAPGIMSLFEPLLNPNGNSAPLQHLTINIARAAGLSIHNIDPNLQWGAFDMLLGKPEFSLLRTVKIAVICEIKISDKDSVKEAFRRTLAYLEGSGKLEVEEVCGTPNY